MSREHMDFANDGEATGTATASVAIAAVDGQQHFIRSIHGSFDGAAQIGTMRFLEGSSVKKFGVHNQRDVYFDPALKFPNNTAAEVKLDLGVSGVNSYVLITGWSRNVSVA